MKKEFSVKEIIEGAYYPGVFIIKINKLLHDKNQYSDFSKEDWRTFVHEYVHFLQDISTCHGYLYFFHKSQMFNLAQYFIKNCTSDVIDLPIQIEKTGVRNASEKQILLDFYNGDHSHIQFRHIKEIKWEYDAVITELVTKETDLEKKLYAVNFYYDDNKVYQFGNVCILESMAYLIEHYLLGEPERKNEFPYNACEAICQIICPELLKDPKKIMMLAETALMHDDCGAFFCKVVNYCAKWNLTELIDEDFKDFCMRFIDETIGDFDQSLEEARKGIDILFPPSFPYTLPTNMQLKMFLECGHNYRIGNKFFISSAFDSLDCTMYMQQLIDMFGVPMLIDGKNDYYGMPGTQNIPVADAVLDILTEKLGEGCALKELCQKSKMGIYDDYKCTNEPWVQCKESECCPVAMYFKGYGIDNKKFRRRP